MTYRWIEHTGELELAVEAAAPEGVLAEAALALGELLPEDRGEATERREIRVDAPDLPALLAEWLNEIVYLSELEGFVPERVEQVQLEGTELTATVEGPLASRQSLIKAVTYHRLEMKSRDDGRWSARVTLDV